MKVDVPGHAPAASAPPCFAAAPPYVLWGYAHLTPHPRCPIDSERAALGQSGPR
jgi:hypothetical protein